MTDVVCYGTAQLAKMQGLSVGGKTGTGYIRQDNGTYLKDDVGHQRAHRRGGRARQHATSRGVGRR
ncbi:MAG: hypothetical protein ACKOAT_11635 [Actinomycetota bacterium]